LDRGKIQGREKEKTGCPARKRPPKKNGGGGPIKKKKKRQGGKNTPIDNLGVWAYGSRKQGGCMGRNQLRGALGGGKKVVKKSSPLEKKKAVGGVEMGLFRPCGGGEQNVRGDQQSQNDCKTGEHHEETETRLGVWGGGKKGPKKYGAGT